MGTSFLVHRSLLKHFCLFWLHSTHYIGKKWQIFQTLHISLVNYMLRFSTVHLPLWIVACHSARDKGKYFFHASVMFLFGTFHNVPSSHQLVVPERGWMAASATPLPWQWFAWIISKQDEIEIEMQTGWSRCMEQLINKWALWRMTLFYPYNHDVDLHTFGNNRDELRIIIR